MTVENLFKAIGGMDEDVLERSETVAKRPSWKIFLPVAACLAIAVVAAFLIPWHTPDRGDPSPLLPPPVNGNWVVNYTEAEMDTSISGPEIYFYEALNSAEMASVLPTDRPDWLQATGKSGFDKEGNLQRISLRLNTTLKYATANVHIMKTSSQDCVIYDGSVSTCNGVEFYVYLSEVGGEQINLGAKAQIQNNWFTFSLQVWKEDLDQAKADFKQILESFTYYAEQDKTTWDSVTYDAIPEMYDKSLSMEEALADEIFGAFVPKTAPEGLKLLSCDRHKSYGNDYLQLSWGEGNVQISWTVTLYDPQRDAQWMTSVYDTYRRSTQYYVIFSAEDLTQNLISTYSGSRLRFRFGVKYGDYLINIASQQANTGNWIWDQLVAMGLAAADKTVYTDQRMSTLEEGKKDTKFGVYIPQNIGTNSIKTYLHRYESENKDYLQVQLINVEDASLLSLHITDYDGQPITAVENTEKYDLTEYVSPWDEAIPETLRSTMERPIFEADKLTLDGICARVYYAAITHKEPRLEFGIRYGDIVIYVFASGLTPEDVYNTIKQIQP